MKMFGRVYNMPNSVSGCTYSKEFNLKSLMRAGKDKSGCQKAAIILRFSVATELGIPFQPDA
jgi:hypothetical protein